MECSDADGDDRQVILIFCSSDGKSVLVHRETSTSAIFPSILLGEDHPLEDCDELSRAVATQLGVGCEFYSMYSESIWEFYHCGGDWMWLQEAVIVEVLNVSFTPPGSLRWENCKSVSKDELAELALLPNAPSSSEPTESGEVVRRVRTLNEVFKRFCGQSNSKNVRMPWKSLGWHKGVTKWIEDVLESSGAKLKQAPVVVCAQERSIVMKARVSDRSVFFKAHKPYEEKSRWPCEATLTEFLFRRFPDFCTPRVLAVNREMNWMLTEEFGEGVEDNLGEDCARPADYGKILETLYKIHSACVGMDEELCSMTCKRQGLEFTREKFLEALNNKDFQQLLDEEMLSDVNANKSTILSKIDAVKHVGIPDTLCHGDPWWPNIAHPIMGEDSYTFFDWEYAAISHPFVDAYKALEHSSLSAEEIQAEGLRYVKRWNKYGSCEDLEDLWSRIPFVMLIIDFVDQYMEDKVERDPIELQRLVKGIVEEVGSVERECRLGNSE
eukprot:Plantae.Rhodophyta-Hildenbrandia_rubra.ctg5889.p1 GENE.Plantae.Rhodophyta-Hildenbrandia_rubra.ctg5889~~Plantae.Rhodophyta-Hildenbrandia_rubra.ctg5889.p1  ORF type:complete len:497 (+),score=60.83 Plantae.Rhodophyta-Hildenbrandia_rubra.ctg5889:1225-2715(+)